jgi:hypothetical protein
VLKTPLIGQASPIAIGAWPMKTGRIAKMDGAYTLRGTKFEEVE